MKRFTTVMCCLAFALGGFFISRANNQRTVKAAPIILQYPKDLAMGHKNNVGLTILHDTIRDTIPLEICCVASTDTVYKTKWRTKKIYVPETISSQVKQEFDTIYISKPVVIIPAVKEETVDSIL